MNVALGVGRVGREILNSSVVVEEECARDRGRGY